MPHTRGVDPLGRGRERHARAGGARRVEGREGEGEAGEGLGGVQHWVQGSAGCVQWVALSRVGWRWARTPWVLDMQLRVGGGGVD